MGRHNEYASKHIKTLPSNPNKTKHEKFMRWLEKIAYSLCKHCILDNRGIPNCIYNYDFPSYCKIEHCPHLEDLDA